VVDALNKSASTADCSSAVGAALQHGFMGKGRNISVMLPYSERLAGFSSWYRQSWAESLGKAGRGSTPIRAVGTTDQHSQLQLYLDGPKDKLFHLITLKRSGTGQIVPLPQGGEFAYLNGRTTGDIMEAQQKATFETFIRNGCPVRHFEIDRLDEATLGGLLMHFTLEIIFMAEMLDVNPFDQPAVEESKALSRSYMQENSPAQAGDL
jgi:glucose-6-phosphate isomerase